MKTIYFVEYGQGTNTSRIAVLISIMVMCLDHNCVQNFDTGGREKWGDG